MGNSERLFQTHVRDVSSRVALDLLVTCASDPIWGADTGGGGSRKGSAATATRNHGVMMGHRRGSSREGQYR
jgi:hypothetical protein